MQGPSNRKQTAIILLHTKSHVEINSAADSAKKVWERNRLALEKMRNSKDLSGDLHQGGVSAMLGLLCVCYMAMSLSCRIQPGGVYRFLRPNSRQDSPYMQASMTEVCSQSCRGTNLHTSTKLKKGFPACLPSSVSQDAISTILL